MSRKYLMQIGYLSMVAIHLLEHIVQMGQHYGLHMSKGDSLGLVGYILPALIKNELLHFSFALFMWIGLWYWQNDNRIWKAAFYFQTWHLFEHVILMIQYLMGIHPHTSIIQLVIPRMELHFFYTFIVTLMIGAAFIYDRIRKE